MLVVDTSVWIDYFRGANSRQTNLLDQSLESDRIVVGDLILAELLQGFTKDKDLRTAKALLDRLEHRDFVGREIAVKSATNYRKLRTKGATVRKTIDVLIGTWCIEHRTPLLHNDHDFEAMEKFLGLRVVR